MTIKETKADGKKQTLKIGFYKKHANKWYVKLYGKVIFTDDCLGARAVCSFLDGWFGKETGYIYNRYFNA